MTNKHNQKPEPKTRAKNGPGQHMDYQIRIKGHLSHQWSDWFEGLSITLEENGDTLLSGPVVDQAALHGLLKKVRDLGMPLVSVIPVKSSQIDTSDVDPFNEIHQNTSIKGEKK